MWAMGGLEARLIGVLVRVVQGGVMGYSLVAISMMILYALALIYREIFSKVYTSPALAPAPAVVLLRRSRTCHARSTTATRAPSTTRLFSSALQATVWAAPPSPCSVVLAAVSSPRLQMLARICPARSSALVARSSVCVLEGKRYCRPERSPVRVRVYS